jgi:hypothetical protein
MSWKLTKSRSLCPPMINVADHGAELKETHLAPLISGSNRSTSTSTVKAEDASPAQDSPELSTVPTNTSTASANGIGMSR